MTSGRRRDRRVYLASHPAMFLLLAATRFRDVVRLGGTVLVHAPSGTREALTRVPLDRLADGTVGAEARQHIAGGVLFDQDGQAHRDARRRVADDLSGAGLDRIRPVWTEVLERAAMSLRAGADVDVVDLAVEIAGRTACALLRLDADPRAVARAARDAAAATVRMRLTPWPWRRRALTAAGAAAARRLAALLAGSPLAADPAGAGLAAMLTVAAVTTTTAGLPRAVAWCADERLWPDTADERAALVNELLRVVSPIPVMQRIAAGAGEIDGCPIRAGDRLLLVTRHAVGAHRIGPDAHRPEPAQISQLVFGVGSHACPGARLARAQLDDAVRVLAPLRPVVRRARVDRSAALPGWRRLIVTAGDAP
jgi:cytochrome P450